MSSAPRRFGVVFAVAAAVVALDQLTKQWAVHALADRDVDIIWTLRLHLARNSGGAFSLNQGRGGLIALGALVVVGAVLWFGRSASTSWGAAAVGLVLGGAVGNLIDRVAREGSGFLGGAVVDFVDLQWWPIFNVADAALTVGVIMLLVESFREQKTEPATP